MCVVIGVGLRLMPREFLVDPTVSVWPEGLGQKGGERGVNVPHKQGGRGGTPHPTPTPLHPSILGKYCARIKPTALVQCATWDPRNPP